MELSQAITGRRSIREYSEKHVSDEVVLEIMQAATMAPSAKNLQPWYFVALSNHEEIQSFIKIMNKSKETFEAELVERFPNNNKVVRETMGFLQTLGGAPCVILAFEYKDSYPDAWKADVTQSVSAAIQNLLLAAYEKGLGTCWLTAPLRNAKEIEALYAPNHGPLVAAITMGYPQQQAGHVISRKEGRFALLH